MAFISAFKEAVMNQWFQEILETPFKDISDEDIHTLFRGLIDPNNEDVDLSVDSKRYWVEKELSNIKLAQAMRRL